MVPGRPWATERPNTLIEMNSNCAKWNLIKLKMMQESFKLRCRQVIFQVPPKCDFAELNWLAKGMWTCVVLSSMLGEHFSIQFHFRWNCANTKTKPSQTKEKKPVNAFQIIQHVYGLRFAEISRRLCSKKKSAPMNCALDATVEQPPLNYIFNVAKRWNMWWKTNDI